MGSGMQKKIMAVFQRVWEKRNKYIKYIKYIYEHAQKKKQFDVAVESGNITVKVGGVQIAIVCVCAGG